MLLTQWQLPLGHAWCWGAGRVPALSSEANLPNLLHQRRKYRERCTGYSSNWDFVVSAFCQPLKKRNRREREPHSASNSMQEISWGKKKKRKATSTTSCLCVNVGCGVYSWAPAILFLQPISSVTSVSDKRHPCLPSVNFLLTTPQFRVV